ncbi:MAG: phenylalanine--tRNA ligase subunit alpha [Firmicutes bacterium]|jgi:phenylalanyl-tRNA synthetase alpha chain|nr:phenylalanine--tRNA ligase subunit alpha [Bacillota bacterium]MDH7496083.1 phenylalanine--tRNA ligase subunit alpha [Bacillota bacterium]
MRDDAENMVSQAAAELAAASNLSGIDEVRVKYLGKKGRLTIALRSLGAYPSEERPIVGKLLNEARESIEAMIARRRVELAALERQKALEAERLDVTMPGTRPVIGARHPIKMVYEELEEIFGRMGFEVADGPDVELDYYNFEALNVPKNHPSRDIQDTFYVSDEVVLRTHTTCVDVRVMKRHKPPVRAIIPGKVYRSDASDPSHLPVFHQLDGFAVEKGITFGDLKGTLTRFAREFFGADTRVRFRPSYFPFTEPSAEMDVSCVFCHGDGCRVCKNTGWLEILGSGLFHPKVLEAVGYDPEEVSGLAFGMGADRIAMLKYGIDDIRLLAENDMRFNRQFLEMSPGIGCDGADESREG